MEVERTKAIEGKCGKCGDRTTLTHVAYGIPKKPGCYICSPCAESSFNRYKDTAREARLSVLKLIHKAQTSHIGSNFGAIDLLTVVFDKLDFDKDRFILSAGWKAAALYHFLWKRGRITKKELDSYCQPGSKFIGLAEPIIPDIPFAGGSMGMGLPASVGFAMAKKMKSEEGRIFCFMSDGEMQCGTTWEAALIAAQHQTNNLVVIVDCNGFQAMGKTKDILSTDPLKKKWEAFGWNVEEIDGHDFEQIKEALRPPTHSCTLNSCTCRRPKVIIANTIKGEGVPFMEHDNLWHYAKIDQKTYRRARLALEN